MAAAAGLTPLGRGVLKGDPKTLAYYHRRREPRKISTVIATLARFPPSSRGDHQVAVAIQEVDDAGSGANAAP